MSDDLNWTATTAPDMDDLSPSERDALRTEIDRLRDEHLERLSRELLGDGDA